MRKSQKIAKRNQEMANPWGLIPPELLRAIVGILRAHFRPTFSCSVFRMTSALAFGGTLRELSLVAEPNPVLSTERVSPLFPRARATGCIEPPPNDALAALVGPCKTLRKLSFLEEAPNHAAALDIAARRRLTEHTSGSVDWVDEAFGGHTQLAILEELPSLPEPAVERILSHLPGLMELTVSPDFDMNARLLAALARSCPGLQVLRCGLKQDRDLAALAPLSGVLKELDRRERGYVASFRGTLRSEESLAAFVGSLSAVTSLNLTISCPPAALEPIASNLTSLALGDLLEEKDLPSPWLCHLETLSLYLYMPVVSAQLSTDVPALAAVLCSLPHLTRLTLKFVYTSCISLSTLLPPDLLNRLEYLHVGINAFIEHFPICITSSSLRQLRLWVKRGPVNLALHCPALVALDLTKMPHRLTSLQCPRLRTLIMPAQSLDGTAPMPDLEVVERSWRWFASEDTLWEDPILMLAGSPRLRVLFDVRLTQPDLLARLCACGSLVRLEGLHLDVTRLPNPLVLRLPQLEHLDLHIERSARPPTEGPPLPPLDLQVVAPELITFSLAIDTESLPSVQVRLRSCPHLVRLALQSSAAAISLHLDEAEEVVGTPPMQPRGLIVDGLDAASLLGLLTRHGSRLRDFSSRRLRAVAPENWPQLMGALSGLPRLTSLAVNVPGAPSPLMLACPHLRTLVLDELSDEAKVALACPLLESLSGIKRPSRQLVLVLPAPNLPPTDDEDDDQR
ncbi:hypothetical protein PAPYR_495 [Paratrimastix pyriformis]|uniref:Uncharacterized protein n=1 Tax=Paratrimastix pyriformis TaxID=342808 RepID=A0ABQ8UTQ8_9EUKA|nr:hypothetical protein PAPYR_495 [Paratrimastix pyriformis]